MLIDAAAHISDAPADVESAARAAEAANASSAVVIGVASAEPSPGLAALGNALDCTVVSNAETARWQVGGPNTDAALARLVDGVERAPIAAMTFARLMREVGSLSTTRGLVAESEAYSMLLAGSEFRTWLEARPRRTPPQAPDQPVQIVRDDARLTITLNVPARHNAFSRWVREGLVEALDLVAADDSIRDVVVRGAGPSFCSGGDLDEFGTSLDPATAHLIRMDRSVAARVDRCRDRITVELHGACIGAGIEIASFAGQVRARADSVISLPELRMGLVPGAGGTVGISRRIGRWRTAYLVLTGESLDPARAMRWGLVDEVDDA